MSDKTAFDRAMEFLLGPMPKPKEIYTTAATHDRDMKSLRRKYAKEDASPKDLPKVKQAQLDEDLQEARDFYRRHSTYRMVGGTQEIAAAKESARRFRDEYPSEDEWVKDIARRTKEKGATHEKVERENKEVGMRLANVRKYGDIMHLNEILSRKRN